MKPQQPGKAAVSLQLPDGPTVGGEPVAPSLATLVGGIAVNIIMQINLARGLDTLRSAKVPVGPLTRPA